MARVKYMNKEQKKHYNLSQYPNFSITGSIYGMKKLYYGMDDLLCQRFLMQHIEWRKMKYD